MFKKIFLLLFISISNTSYADCMSEKPENIDDILKALSCLQKEITKIKKTATDDNEKIVVNTFPNIKKASISKTINIWNFQVDLIKCKQISEKVTCNFIITNLGKDQDFKIFKTEGSFYDELGENYKISSVNMNNGGSSRKFITNIPIKNITITINNVPKNVTQFTRFKLRVYSSGTSYLKFENVAILK